MEDRETPRMRKYWESKTTRIMMATVPHVTSGSGQKISGRWIFVRQNVRCVHDRHLCVYVCVFVCVYVYVCMFVCVCTRWLHFRNCMYIHNLEDQSI